jgi:hypothetical protein
MGIKGAQERITKAATSWEGVTAKPHRFGGVEYTIGKREIGHIHGDYALRSWLPGAWNRIIFCPRRVG